MVIGMIKDAMRYQALSSRIAEALQWLQTAHRYFCQSLPKLQRQYRNQALNRDQFERTRRRYRRGQIPFAVKKSSAM